MAGFQQVPGFTGYIATRTSSMDKRAIGKLTDSNHLESLHMMEPTEYDKKIITLYTQTSLYANDFLQMINKSTPFTLNTNSDFWQWNINVPYKFPKIIAIPDTTTAMAKPGIDGQEFEIVLDTNEYVMNDVITIDKRYAPDWTVIADPLPYGGVGYLYKLTLNSATPKTDYVDPMWLRVGLECQRINVSIGEFDVKLGGLGRLGEEIKLYESLSAGYGLEHTVTGWADARTLKDNKGNPLDIMVYAQYRNNEMGKKEIMDVRWEPFIEMKMRKTMMDLKVERMIWSKGGTSKTYGSKQEIKRHPQGLYYKMRNNGNRVEYPRGQFSINILRDVFGDLFYRRKDIKDRRVKLYTNEAGIEAFRKANKEDLLNSGLTVIADDRFIEGRGQQMMISYAFESVTTMETGRVDVVHLRELDLPQTNTEFGQNKKSTPIFFVFDVSDSDNGLLNNIREVRHQGQPSMTWGYVDGRRHHLGFAKSQGMNSASKDPGYTIWMEDRADIFVEDLSRTVLIEERPQF